MARTKKTEPIEVTPEVTPLEQPKKRTPRAKAPAAEAAAPKPAATRGRRGPAKKAPEFLDEEGRVVVEWRALAAKPEPVVAAPGPVTFDIDSDYELPMPTWRPRGAAPATSEDDEDKGTLAPRRSRRRGRKEPISAADALQAPVPEPIETDSVDERRGRRRGGRAQKPKEAAPEPTAVVPEIPAPPKRERIPVPMDAPRVMVSNGHSMIVKNGRIIPPIFFYGDASDDKRRANVLDEMRMAAENGIQLFGFHLELISNAAGVQSAIEQAKRLLDDALTVSASANVVFRIEFVAPDGADQVYPRSRYTTLKGKLAAPSIADDEYWGEAEKGLSEVIDALASLPNREAILGVHLDRDEWFYHESHGYDTSPASVDKFRDWLRVRYRNDVVALRASWFDARVDFATAQIPPYVAPSTDEFVRLDRRQRRWVDFSLYLSDAMVERIGNLAYAVKKASNARFLVGVSYGYTFEWDYSFSGHLSLGKLLRTREIDMIAGPPSYRSREAGQTGPFPSPIDSFTLNGKIYISEEDFKTPISNGRVEVDDHNPVIRTPQALENVQWRGAGAALAHASGICWMDKWGNGWLGSPGIWQRGGMTCEALTRSLGSTVEDPDVAVFIDERSLAYLSDRNAFRQLVQSVRESVMRSGLSAGFYLLSDLAHRERFPEAKLNVFVNAWDMRPEVRSAIKSRLQRGNKVLFFIHAAGIFDSGRDSLERVREVTGIALKPQPFACKSGSTLLDRRHPLCEALPESALATGSGVEPTYFAIPEDALVLGEYSQTGLPSFVVREFRDPESHDQRWTSVFLGEPVVTPALFRALGEMAGAQPWNYHDDVVHVRPPYLTVHCTSTGPRAIALPEKWAAYSLNNREWTAIGQTHLRFNAMDGSTQSFLVGHKTEIEAILRNNPDQLLTAPEVIAEDENTIEPDHLNFDIPIMKLGEWMEEGWSDEMADDFLLKPSQLDVELPEELSELDTGASPGRRRRRRRRRAKDDAPNPQNEAAMAEFGMNVVFRKRE